MNSKEDMGIKVASASSILSSEKEEKNLALPWSDASPPLISEMIDTAFPPGVAAWRSQMWLVKELGVEFDHQIQPNKATNGPR